ncbi:MAG: hypothetical protein H0T56_10850 [Pseudaminobacter sp.]|nr:hypothetical protein [Pseudaminobacter sp.]
MPIAKIVGALAVGFAVMSLPEDSRAGNTPAGVNEAAPARPGHLAELEELQAARAKVTVAAYDLFLARHPDSRYAEQARNERKRLTAGQK